MVAHVLGLLLVAGAQSTVDVRIVGGHFVPAHVRVARGVSIRLTNADAEAYTLEGPGALDGDLAVAPNSVQTIVPRREGGRFVALLEERPEEELRLDIEPDPSDAPATEPLFDQARRVGRQALLPVGRESAYGCLTAFDLNVRGEAGRQGVLKDLYRIAEELSNLSPPPELAPFLVASDWARLRPSVGFVVGLGPGAFDGRRFGRVVASARPPDLHPARYAVRLGISGDVGQRDVLVRATSDSAWLNARVCRLVWARLRGRIVRPTMDAGYANPNGRSPILGGFFDGTGNPGGAAREGAAYPAGRTGTYLAYLRVRFDEERFAALTLRAREALVGRERAMGRPVRKALPDAHRTRARNDGKSAMVRIPLVFDEGPGRTGLLFLCAQSSLTGGIERILGFMMAGSRRDGLMGYMGFEAAAHYWVPGSPHGSYPGSLRRGP